MSALAQEVLEKIQHLNWEERQHVLHALQQEPAPTLSTPPSWLDWAEAFSMTMRRQAREAYYAEVS